MPVQVCKQVAASEHYHAQTCGTSMQTHTGTVSTGCNPCPCLASCYSKPPHMPVQSPTRQTNALKQSMKRQRLAHLHFNLRSIMLAQSSMSSTHPSLKNVLCIMTRPCIIQGQPTCNLFDLGDGHSPPLSALTLVQSVEHHAPDVEVQAHAHRIAGHQQCVLVVGLVEEASLLATRLGRQGSIHHTDPA